jgi:hypothetical protein
MRFNDVFRQSDLNTAKKPPVVALLTLALVRYLSAKFRLVATYKYKMSLLDKLVDDPIISKYLSYYTKLEHYEALKATLVYGI